MAKLDVCVRATYSKPYCERGRPVVTPCVKVGANTLRRVSLGIHGPNHKWWDLGTVAIGILMATLDSGMISVSLPRMMAYFRVSIDTIQWVVLAYLLLITVTLLSFGRLADMIGRKRIFSVGVLIFALGSALCGTSGSAELLIAYRVFQAVGASMIMANSMAIASAVFPPKERGMALGIIGTIVAIGVTLGPSIGGVLTESLSWRSVFFLNLPIGIVGAIMGFVVLRDEEMSAPLSGRRLQFDYAGALIAGFGLLALMMALAGGGQIDSSGGLSAVLYGVALLAALAFVFIERRQREPLIDLSLFRRQLFALGSASGLLMFLAVSANMFLMPFYLQLVLGFPPSQAGLMMVPTSIALGVIAPFSGWLSDRMGARLLSTAGILMVCVALLGLSQLEANSGYGDVLVRLILLGLGQGLFQSPNNSSVIGAVPRERYGVASSFLSMMRNLGMVMGAALASSLLIAAIAEKAGHVNLDVLRTAGAAGSPSILSGFMSGMEQAYIVAAFLAVAGILASLSRGGSFRGGPEGGEASVPAGRGELPAFVAAGPPLRRPAAETADGSRPAAD
ncbi:MAG: MFS transporter [Chloroflexi bacterium]|nr:MFS transporter [Chloroflexota bacterium]